MVTKNLAQLLFFKIKIMKQETRGRKPINKKDVRNIRFQIALSENQVEAVGSKEQVYELLHKTIENVENN